MVVRGVRVGETYEVEIKSLTAKGDGFTRIKGVATFVKNTVPGWKGVVVIKKVGPSYLIAEPINSDQSSSDKEQ